MKTARWLSVLLALVLVASACDDGGDGGAGDPRPTRGVKRGTLRVHSLTDVDALDPGVAYATFDSALLRGMVRELYSFDTRLTGERSLVPVPDLADGPYLLSDDGRTYTFRIRRGVRYASPVDREVKAADFIYAVERQLDPDQPPPGSPNPYARLISGADDFAAGRAGSISGMKARDSHVLEITLDRPASDFPSILTLPFFSPVPEEFASKFALGEEYAQRVVASGPYKLDQYTPGRRIELVRNENWDPRTDPLRSAWVDKVDVTIGRSEAEIQEAIEDQGDADLNLDAVPPPVGDLQRLSDDPALARRLAVETTGCVHYLTMQMDAGPTRELAVRKAVNFAIDRQAVVLAIGGAYAGAPASTVLSPTLAGYSAFDLYPSQDAAGDPDKARELLAEAGYPDGVTLTYVGRSEPRWKALYEVLESSLGRAGIKLEPTFYDGLDAYNKSLRLRAKREEHHLGAARWCPDVPGNGARSVGVLLDGRLITPTANNNYGSYDNPKVNQLIDQAYGARDEQAGTALWGQIDRLVMEDAAWAPLVYDRETFFWSSRVRNWTFTPWLSNPDITNLWLDPNTP